MFNYSLAILAMFWVLEIIKRYSINSAYTITISIVQAFLLIAGSYILWYYYKETKRLQNQLRLLRKRNIRVQSPDCTDTIKCCEGELNFIYRILTVVQLNNRKYYNNYKHRLNRMLAYSATQYVIAKRFTK